MLPALRAFPLICALLPAVATAHPHVFVDVALNLHYDAQGRLARIEQVRSYDPLYSLLVVTETGDPGPQGYRAGRLAALQGLDANWDPVTGGRLVVTSAGGPVAMAPPQHLLTRLEGDRLVSRHSHVLPRPVAGDQPVSISIHDPGYYVEFSLPAQVQIAGRAGCRAARQAGDAQVQGDAYAAALRRALLREMGQAGPGEPQVDIGGIGAASIRVACGD